MAEAGAAESLFRDLTPETGAAESLFHDLTPEAGAAESRFRDPLPGVGAAPGPASALIPKRSVALRRGRHPTPIRTSETSDA